VSDHGPGIALRHLPKVFEPFYRGENELTRTSKGTGIGLSLVRGLVERMGGTVQGENAPTGGFVVSILLPIASG
jgi:signal transduction histidine kinase